MKNLFNSLLIIGWLICYGIESLCLFLWNLPKLEKELRIANGKPTTEI